MTLYYNATKIDKEPTQIKYLSIILPLLFSPFSPVAPAPPPLPDAAAPPEVPVPPERASSLPPLARWALRLMGLKDGAAGRDGRETGRDVGGPGTCYGERVSIIDIVIKVILNL